ncbi:MAG: IS110 family transposase [Oscillospiraceae bacterium]|jgi:transposase|nr:IS110 family transposase [Oscillospiraceae bacterium]
MVSVGIDVSKGKSMVAALRPMGEAALAPREFAHTSEELKAMSTLIRSLGEETRVVMEATGRYHEPAAAALLDAGLFVCVLNPIVIHQSGAGSVRKVKNDRKDALKIAKYGLDNWTRLCQRAQTGVVRQQLKLFNRQYNRIMQTVVSPQNNLISLLDKSFPGGNELFDRPLRKDGHRKWLDFAEPFWHCERVCRVSLKAFTERYSKWRYRNGYHDSANKAAEIYRFSQERYTTLAKYP